MLLEACAELDAGCADMSGDGIRWQLNIVSAVLNYMDSVPLFFESLFDAHTLLSAAGISIVSEKAPDASPLLERLCEAHKSVSNMCELLRTPMKTIRSTLQACLKDLSQANEATAEFKRHSERVQALKVGHDSMALARTTEKMQQTADRAKLARIRAKDLLQACTSRRGDLLQSTSQVLGTVIEAFGIATGCRLSLHSSVTLPEAHSSDGVLTLNFATRPSLFQSSCDCVMHDPEDVSGIGLKTRMESRDETGDLSGEDLDERQPQLNTLPGIALLKFPRGIAQNPIEEEASFLEDAYLVPEEADEGFSLHLDSTSSTMPSAVRNPSQCISPKASATTSRDSSATTATYSVFPEEHPIHMYTLPESEPIAVRIMHEYPKAMKALPPTCFRL